MLSSSLSLLWGLINTLQIVAHFPLLVISYPENAQIYSDMLLSMATMDLIPEEVSDEIVRELLGIKEDAEQTEVTLENLSTEMTDAGYDTAS